MMPRSGTGNTSFKDISGMRFGSWTALREAGKRGKLITWLCKCDCGTEREVIGGHLRNGKTKSCGCMLPKGASHSRFKHGMSETPEFKIWLQILTRCTNPNTKDWEHYGGKGISVCERWKSDFLSFFADMGPRPSSKHSIDREDISRDYEPGNCRWATPIEQARNTSRTRWVELEGQKVSLAEACERTGVPYATASERLLSGRDWRGERHGL